MSTRITADPEQVEQGLAQLVLTVIELLRQLMERQALHRIEGGTLTVDEIERLGQTFTALAEPDGGAEGHVRARRRGPEPQPRTAGQPPVTTNERSREIWLRRHHKNGSSSS